jgi:hypothetical protein
MIMTVAANRPSIPDRVRLAAWVAAAGRCTFCNRFVLENEDLGEPVPIGELAHNVGRSANSPRGDADLPQDLRQAAENLLLLCRNCHKPADDGGVVGRYSVDELTKRKHNHESRIRFPTSIGADRSSTILRVVGRIRSAPPALTYDTVLEATTATGTFPQLLSGSHRAEYDLDLRQVSNEGSQAYFTTCANEIDTMIDRINDGIRRDDINRLSVFAFARIPLLVHLGARLDDKIRTDIYQRQRADDKNAWRWPATPPSAPSFSFRLARSGQINSRVALVVSLSGTVPLNDLPDTLSMAHIYELYPDPPTERGPTVISSPSALANFEAGCRRFLAHVEGAHGRLSYIDLFPATPLSPALTLGRVLMPEVSPAWHVYDRNQAGQFALALAL